jgi:hypothetical protein
MDKKISWLIIGLAIGLILGGAAGYIIKGNIPRNNFGRNNFQIDENTKSDIISFFDNTSDMNEITEYCDENRFYCMYYCREINPEHEICSTIQMPANRSMGR